ncbi:hypothetical protein SCG7086_BY_00010, partial [Chlamydiales bacterium SCGC AG-110-P3]
LMAGLAAYCLFAPKASMGLRQSEKQLLINELENCA